MNFLLHLLSSKGTAISPEAVVGNQVRGVGLVVHNGSAARRSQVLDQRVHQLRVGDVLEAHQVGGEAGDVWRSCQDVSGSCQVKQDRV